VYIIITYKLGIRSRHDGV